MTRRALGLDTSRSDGCGIIYARRGTIEGGGGGGRRRDGNNLGKRRVVALGNEDLRLERSALGRARVVRARLALLARAARGPAELGAPLALCGSGRQRALGLHLHRERGRERLLVLELLAFGREDGELGLGLEEEVTSSRALADVAGVENAELKKVGLLGGNLKLDEIG